MAVNPSSSSARWSKTGAGTWPRRSRSQLLSVGTQFLFGAQRASVQRGQRAVPRVLSHSHLGDQSSIPSRTFLLSTTGHKTTEGTTRSIPGIKWPECQVSHSLSSDLHALSPEVKLTKRVHDVIIRGGGSGGRCICEIRLEIWATDCTLLYSELYSVGKYWKRKFLHNEFGWSRDRYRPKF
jgi:hypothetical protein